MRTGGEDDSFMKFWAWDKENLPSITHSIRTAVAATVSRIRLAIIALGFHLQLNRSRLTESVSKTATRIWNFFPMSFRRNSCRSVLFNDTRFLNPSMRYELETSWHVLIASASSIGYDWGPAACRRWNEDVFSPFRDSSGFRRQSPDCSAHRTLNVPNSVLEL